MISSKFAVSAAAIAAAAIGGQAAASAASAATVTPAHRSAARSVTARSARPAALAKPLVTADVTRSYTVQSGDTLSAIGARFGIAWQGLYAANIKVVGANPNLIYVGQVLALTGAASQQPAQPVQGSSASDQHQAQQPASQASNSSYSGAAGSFQQCVIQRESGGNSQVMNSSGHYGLYQFSQSAWDAAGGNPADFGHASAAEQNQVFSSAYAKWGTSPWAPYDGC